MTLIKGTHPFTCTGNTTDKSAIEKLKQDYDGKIQDLVVKYEQEVRNKEKLREDMNKLKSQYEKEEVKNKLDKDTEQNTVFKKMEILQAIQGQMVGGEKANDAELKERRARKKKIAETKTNAVSEALTQLNDDDRVLLKAYGDVTEELRAKSVLMKKAKRKIISLEQEVKDLQSEFETERTDYLETIRRLNKQLKLFNQICDKIEPFLVKHRLNYANIEQIKNNSVWDENVQQWILPEIGIERIKLPPTDEKSVSVNSNHGRDMTPSKIYRPDSSTSFFDSDIVDGHSSDMSYYEDRLLKKMENSNNNEITTNYFKPKRREQLLNNLHKLKISKR